MCRFSIAVTRAHTFSHHLHCVEAAVHASGAGQPLGAARLCVPPNGANLQKLQHEHEQHSDAGYAHVYLRSSAGRQVATVLALRRVGGIVGAGNRGHKDVHTAKDQRHR